MIRKPFDRRQFIGGTGVALAGLVSAWPSLAKAASAAPDIIVFNAKVHTVDAAIPYAEAFAIKGDRFVAIGRNDEIKAYANAATRQVDAGGATIVPGFIDAHIHAAGEPLLYDVLVGNPFEVEFVSIASIQAKLRERAEKTQPGYWVNGIFYDDTKVTDKRPLNRQDLDKVSTECPISVRHRGGHTAWYNSKAFELAGVTRDTPNPPGGEFFRDKNGDLTGRVAERANMAFAKVGKREEFSAAQAAERGRAGAAHFSKELVRYGVTSVQTNTRTLPDLAALQEILANGDLRHRVTFEVSGDLLDAMIANGIKSGFGNEWLKLGATSEHTVDGSFSERTMAINAGYPGTNPKYYGIITEEQDVLNAWVERVHRAGIRLNCHANGDKAIESTLTAYERALKLFPVRDSRPKITHCTMVNDDILRRIKALGVVPAPFTTYAYYNTDKFHFYGKDIMEKSMAFRSFIDAGITAAAGSDYGPGPFAPLMGLQGMVTRKGWNGEVWGASQRVTVQEALKISTLNGAYASHDDAIKGSISAGKLADFVVLSKDPYTVDPNEIMNIKIVRTVVGGKTVYEA